jgi:hypothetical protein
MKGTVMNRSIRRTATASHNHQRMLRRLCWTLGFSAARGIGYASGTALVSVLIWWLTSR